MTDVGLRQFVWQISRLRCVSLEMTEVRELLRSKWQKNGVRCTPYQNLFFLFFLEISKIVINIWYLGNA